VQHGNVTRLFLSGAIVESNVVSLDVLAVLSKVGEPRTVYLVTAHWCSINFAVYSSQLRGCEIFILLNSLKAVCSYAQNERCIFGMLQARGAFANGSFDFCVGKLSVFSVLLVCE